MTKRPEPLPFMVADTKLASRDLAVLIVLFESESVPGKPFPMPRKFLANVVGSEKTYISKITAKLESLGWLEKGENTGAFSRPGTYALSVPKARINADRVAKGFSEVDE